MYSRLVDSPIGTITLVAEEGAVTGLYFGDAIANSMKNSADKGAPENAKQKRSQEEDILDQCEKELAAYFIGKLRTFTVPIRAVGTPFRERVWEALLQIPYGETVSYLDIAKEIGNPKAVRAVGGANHNNPISIIIPCHRVIGTNGSLTGYGGGMDAKQWLLELEGKYKNGAI